MVEVLLFVIAIPCAWWTGTFIVGFVQGWRT